jgi:preprotein translocase subunit SecF
MKLAVRFISQNLHWRYMVHAKPAAYVSLALVLAILALVATRGLNYGIDFSGGIAVEIRTTQPADLASLRPLFTNPDYGETNLQRFGDVHNVLIRMQGNPQKEQAAIVEEVKRTLTTALGAGVEFRRVDYVGPAVGKEMLQSGVLSLVCAFAGIMLYIWFRFEWQFGLGGLLALLHDAIMVVGFFAITRLEFGLTSVAAILTVIGYSINDSVVIYDRIRENLRKHNGKTMDEIIDLSLNQTLSRTILTSVTALGAAAILAWLGGEVIRGFSLALFVGILVGTYSSIYISAPVLKVFALPKGVFLADEPPLVKSTVKPAR